MPAAAGWRIMTRKAAAVTMRQALADPALLGGVLAGELWGNWTTFLIATNGEKLNAAERKIFQKFTGREREPGERVEEALFLIGRRGGKDRATSVLASYLAALVDWSPVLAKGERGVLLVVGVDTRAAQIQRDYIEGVFDASPMLSSLVANKTADTIELTTGITIEVRAASFRRNRGMTCVGVVLTEPAFLHDENSSNPDVEILTALRPTLLTTGGPLLMLTTPYAQRGEVYNLYQRHFGPTGDPRILVVQGTSRDFNSMLPQKVIDRAFERDPVTAASEYGAQFRTDLEDYVKRSAVMACIAEGVSERAPERGVQYAGFIDPSGGSSDSMTLAIGYRDREGKTVLAYSRASVPPFSPSAVCTEFAEILKAYGIHSVKSDKYGGEWVVEAFHTQGIRCEQSADPKSDLYLSLLPLINSGEVSLLDDARLVNELCGLERRTARSGKELIDHRPGAHDDIANAVAGCLVGLALQPTPIGAAGWLAIIEASDRDARGERAGLQRLRARGLV